MSVISGFFKQLAAKIEDPTQSAFALSEALNADPTRTGSDVRKAQAERLTDPDAKAALLLEGLSNDGKKLATSLLRIGASMSIQSEFTAASGDKRPSMNLSVRHNGQNLLDFKASASEGGYYLEIEENSAGGAFSLSMNNNLPVATFEEVETRLAKNLDSTFRIPKDQAKGAMQMIARNL